MTAQTDLQTAGDAGFDQAAFDAATAYVAEHAANYGTLQQAVTDAVAAMDAEDALFDGWKDTNRTRLQDEQTAQEEEVAQKRADFDDKEMLAREAQEVLNEASRALKQNRDESMVVELQLALSEAQDAFDVAVREETIAEKYWEQLNYQLSNDNLMREDIARQERDQERQTREDALNGAQVDFDRVEGELGDI